MSKVLGRCPKCGADYVDGYYGPYCTGKCGFRLRRVLGKDLTGDEITALLKGEKILLKDLTSRRTGNLYNMYVQPQEVEEYTFQNRNGEEVTGYRFKYIMTFPDWSERKSGSSVQPNPDNAGRSDFNGGNTSIAYASSPWTASASSGNCNFDAAPGMGQAADADGWDDDEIPFR